ncbi:MAG: hypothetical protein VKJ64_07635 [Leptolyngbyaceae bacterium]|nr:hypothetical protein [Leptolyngbyaceae bacterium]
MKPVFADTGFLIMEELQLNEVLAHDKHFRQTGFIILLGNTT